MGIFSRVANIFKAKANTVLNELENPEETLNYSIVEMKEQLNKIKKSLVDITTVKKGLENELEDIQGKIQIAENQAELAVASNREDLARAALEKKQNLVEEKERLSRQIEELSEKQSIIQKNKEHLESELSELETKKQELIAMNRAAEAQMAVKEALTGISSEMNDIKGRIERAEKRIKEKKAKVSAMDELIEMGALEELEERDNVEAELSKIHREELIKQELERLKQKRQGRNE
ncbi:PspA/IM30 family protein [Biomaibacter acetigenes]|uniref:PspA/IM30 family protein n=1 Tax=Biomaibacter acetigenes TaxID=2316383 RepID=A0A3G2R7D8_9FIRM|nr:PspA/IM30 family protein [Biomaibacter acetigenes]AYO30998.1 PspA/IM30 family protein [Biomaibacter acetigenes]